MTDTIEFTAQTDTSEGGSGNDLMNADDVMVVSDDTTIEGYPEIAGNFRDTAEGETADDPYSNFNFTVTWDADG